MNFDTVINSGQPFIFCVGGRGTGKTYGALKYVLDNNIKFIYMRRTQAQVDIITKPEFSPFKAICGDTEYNIVCKSITKYNSGFYNGVYGDDGLIYTEGEPLGYTVALSTVSNLRGFDMSDVDILIYDEFIAERHERPLKDEASALFNCYETINRNREIKGKRPLILLCLANANNLQNPIFSALNLIDKSVKMARTGKEFSIMQSRGIALYILRQSPISKQKSTTALYKTVGEGDFYNMAIGNQFDDDIQQKIRINIREYTPVVQVADLIIYSHKSRTQFYVTHFKSGSCKEVTEKAFKMTYLKTFVSAEAQELILYDNYEVQTKFQNLLC